MATEYREEIPQSTGVIKTIVKTAVTAWNDHTFSSAKIDFVSVKNAGTEAVRIAWDNDDKDASPRPEYTELAPGERLPTVRITEGTVMHFCRHSGTGGHRLEIIAWG